MSYRVKQGLNFRRQVWFASLTMLTILSGTVLAKPPAILSTPGDFQLSSEDPKVRQQSIQLLLSMIQEGSEVPPERLIGALADAKLPPEEGVPAFQSLLQHSSPEIRFKALWALGRQYGTEAQSIVPGILLLLNQPDNNDAIHAAAARMLGRIGVASPAVLEALTSQLTQPGNNTLFAQTNILQALGALGPAASNAAPLLESKLADATPAIQQAAFGALAAILGPTLIEPTSQPPGGTVNLTPTQLIAVLQSIPEGQSLARSTVEWLSRLFANDARPFVKDAVIKKIGKLVIDDPRLVRVLLAALDSADEQESKQAEKILEQVRSEQLGNVVPDIVDKLVRGGSPKSQEHSAKLLRKMGASANPAVPALLTALRSSHAGTDTGVILSYLDALRGVGPSATGAGTVLVGLLPEQHAIFQNRDKRSSHHLRALMLATLAEVGPPASALPFILDALANSGPAEGELFVGAARAAGALGPAAREAIPYLLRPLEPDFRNLLVRLDADRFHHGTAGEFTTPRIEAMRALAKMGAEASAAIGLLSAIVETTPERPDNPERLQQVPDEGREARLALGRIRGN